MNIEFPLFAGLLAAMIHVITGPDHLAAVLPFAIESKRKAWKIGLFWGIGHLLGMLSIGALFVLFRDLIPVERISEHSEKLVGLVLIGIGIWSFYRIFKKPKQHDHLHVHANHNVAIHAHSHAHTHQHPNTHTHTHAQPIRQNYFSALSIGVLHGLAGIAHFILFFPVIGFATRLDSWMYITGFAAGTLIAMMAFGSVVGALSNYSSTHENQNFFKGIRMAAGSIAIIIGLYWVFAN